MDESIHYGVNALNPNSYWYLGLAILSIVLLIVVCVKQKSLWSLLCFFPMIGLGYLIEAVIYIFLECYVYYPKLIDHDKYFDSNTGAIASNALSLPAVATLIGAFQLRNRWIVIFTCLFVGIEQLFLKLGIYEHNWWKLGYTAIGLPFYFLMAKYLYGLTLRPLKGVRLMLPVWLIIGAIGGTSHILPIMLLSFRSYSPGWFDDPSHDTTAFSAVYYITMSMLIMVMVKLHWKYRATKYVVTIAFVSLVTFVLYIRGLLQIHVWWDPVYYAIMPVLILLLAENLTKLLAKGPRSLRP